MLGFSEKICFLEVAEWLESYFPLNVCGFSTHWSLRTQITCLNWTKYWSLSLEIVENLNIQGVYLALFYINEIWLSSVCISACKQIISHSSEEHCYSSPANEHHALISCLLSIRHPLNYQRLMQDGCSAGPDWSSTDIWWCLQLFMWSFTAPRGQQHLRNPQSPTSGWDLPQLSTPAPVGDRKSVV